MSAPTPAQSPSGFAGATPAAMVATMAPKPSEHAASRGATEAVLLVGGKGTRLRPLTVNPPKPMIPAAGVPFLTHQLARARAAGIRHVVLATSYLAEVFEPYF